MKNHLKLKSIYTQVVLLFISGTVFAQSAIGSNDALELRIFTSPSWCMPCRDLETYMKKNGIQFDSSGNGKALVKLDGKYVAVKIRLIDPEDEKQVPDRAKAVALGHYVPSPKGEANGDEYPALPYLTVFRGGKRIDDGRHSNDNVTKGRGGQAIEAVLSGALKTEVKIAQSTSYQHEAVSPSSTFIEPTDAGTAAATPAY